MNFPLAGHEQLVRDQITALLRKHPPNNATRSEFWGAQFDAGLAWVHFPEGEGGLGVDARLQQVVTEALSEADAPSNRAVNIIGVGMAGPTIATHGTAIQRRRFLRPLFTCEEIWCQLFSEPGAGSDLASVTTLAEQDGDTWILNGQKVWTTLGHVARRAILLARSDRDAPKHQGLSYFLLDMQSPGVEVRPLRQMTGDAEFNEVFLTDVRIPDSDRLGAIGAGWRVARTTLMNERVSIGGTVAVPGGGSIGVAVDVWRESGPPSPVRRDHLVQLWVEAEVNRLTNLRAQHERERGEPGPAGSIAKLAYAELNQHVYEFALNLMGAEAMLYESYAMTRPEQVELEGVDIRHAFLRSRANSIEGGTSEILRNILGEHVLGLPGEPRVT